MSEPKILNSTNPSSATPVGGQYNSMPPAPADGQTLPVQLDSQGNLLVNVAVGGGVSTVKIEDTSGNALNSNGSGALQVAVVSGGGSNPSVGTTGAAAPTSATEVGLTDVASGHLVSANSDVRGSKNALAVEIVDAIGNQITSFGSSTVTANQGTAAATSGAWPTENVVNVSGTLQVQTGVNPTGSVYAAQEDVTSWGGTSIAAATATPAGTEVAPVTRSFSPKVARAISTTVPGTSATTYYGPGGASTTRATAGWFDTQQTGATHVELSWYIQNWQAAGSNALYIVSVDDPNNSSTMPIMAVGSLTPSASGAQSLTGLFRITQRYWQVYIIMGTTSASAMEMTSIEWASPITPYLDSNNAQLSSWSFSGTDAMTSVTGYALTPTSLRIAGSSPVIATAPLAVQPVATTGNSTGPYYLLRTPNIFKTAQATASGNTALWTPTSGKKFRLMKFMVQITGNATVASGAVVTVSFQDATTAINIAMDAFVPSSSLGTGDDFVSPWVDLGNGYLSVAANNVLNVNLSSALTAGNVRVTCCGTEE